MARKKRDPKAFVTNETLDEAVEAILKGIDGLYKGLKKEMNKRFGKVEKRLGSLETDVKFIKRDMLVI